MGGGSNYVCKKGMSVREGAPQGGGNLPLWDAYLV